MSATDSQNKEFNNTHLNETCIIWTGTTLLMPIEGISSRRIIKWGHQSFIDNLLGFDLIRDVALRNDATSMIQY